MFAYCQVFVNFGFQAGSMGYEWVPGKFNNPVVLRNAIVVVIIFGHYVFLIQQGFHQQFGNGIYIIVAIRSQ